MSLSPCLVAAHIAGMARVGMSSLVWKRCVGDVGAWLHGWIFLLL